MCHDACRDTGDPFDREGSNPLRLFCDVLRGEQKRRGMLIIAHQSIL